MRQFFKFMFASMLGTFIMLFLTMLIFFGIITAMIASIDTNKHETITANTVLHLDFPNPIPDRGSGNPFDNFNFETFQPNVVLGLNEILENIEKAKNDDQIKGIYLNTSMVNAGFATLEEIRDALMDFRESGKFIIAYSEIYTQTSYYLATAADKIYINPAGYFDLKGLSAQLMFFKGTMEKLDIEPQVIRHGKFKSAIEPFILDKMSPENRKQTNQLVGSIWDHLVKEIGESRNISVNELNSLADQMAIRKAEDALQYRLVDKISYGDEVVALLKEKAGVEEDKELNLVKIGKYRKVAPSVKKDGKTAFNNRLAIIYASGEIREGESQGDIMGSQTVAKAISDARKDEKVKAIVLRVNSPGGSALASDVIWREMKLAKEAKPTVVSMGNVAASGGYYIACAADRIIASENTITGSIGVFGLVPNMKGFFNNKLGITIDTIKTNRHADINTVFRPLTETEKNIIQQVIENIYSDFIQHVAEGRNMSVGQVDSIGQGRVWSGTDALKIGLIDEFGGLDRAVEIAAELAELGEDYRIKNYPEQEEPFQMLVKSLSEDVEETWMKTKLGGNWQYYQYIENFTTQRGIFTRIPFDYLIE